jgi:hypothetical protein
LPSLLFTSGTSFIFHPAVSPSAAVLIATHCVPDRLYCLQVLSCSRWRCENSGACRSCDVGKQGVPYRLLTGFNRWICQFRLLMLPAVRSTYHYLCYQLYAVRITTYVASCTQYVSLLMLPAVRSTYHYLCYQLNAVRITTYVTSCTQYLSLLMLPAARSTYHYLCYQLHAVRITMIELF